MKEGPACVNKMMTVKKHIFNKLKIHTSCYSTAINISI